MMWMLCGLVAIVAIVVGLLGWMLYSDEKQFPDEFYD